MKIFLNQKPERRQPQNVTPAPGLPPDALWGQGARSRRWGPVLQLTVRHSVPYQPPAPLRRVCPWPVALAASRHQGGQREGLAPQHLVWAAKTNPQTQLLLAASPSRRRFLMSSGDNFTLQWPRGGTSGAGGRPGVRERAGLTSLCSRLAQVMIKLAFRNDGPFPSAASAIIL